MRDFLKGERSMEKRAERIFRDTVELEEQRTLDRIHEREKQRTERAGGKGERIEAVVELLEAVADILDVF